jgi:hypothetical protein
MIGHNAAGRKGAGAAAVGTALRTAAKGVCTFFLCARIKNAGKHQKKHKRTFSCFHK